MRFYRGKIPMKILFRGGKKALVEYVEDGVVGPKDLSKTVKKGDRDIVLIRHCWRRANTRNLTIKQTTLDKYNSPK